MYSSWHLNDAPYKSCLNDLAYTMCWYMPSKVNDLRWSSYTIQAMDGIIPFNRRNIRLEKTHICMKTELKKQSKMRFDGSQNQFCRFPKWVLMVYLKPTCGILTMYLNTTYDEKNVDFFVAQLALKCKFYKISNA